MEHDSFKKGNTKATAIAKSVDLEYDDSIVLQSLRVRRSSILANSSNWEFMVRECRFVWYSGIIFWTLLIISLAL
jgi:hypothetical protein